MADLMPMPTFDLAVGDPARRPLGRAVLGSLALAALFVVAILPAPALPTMWSRGPWAQSALGVSEQRVGWPDFNELVLGIAAVTAIGTVMVESLVHLSRRRHLPGR